MKNKWIVAGIIFLSVINISALGTFLYNQWHRNNETCTTSKMTDYGCYMKDQVGISDEQAANLNMCEQTYNPRIQALSLQIKEIRINLIKELVKEKSDTVRIEEFLTRIDSLQAGIQREVIKRLLQEKTILTKEQQQKFFSCVLNRFCTEIDSIKQTQCQP